LVSLSLSLREEHKLRMFGNRVEEHIWTEEGGSDRRLEQTA
jgi:hypothetical protein